MTRSNHFKYLRGNQHLSLQSKPASLLFRHINLFWWSNTICSCTHFNVNLAKRRPTVYLNSLPKHKNAPSISLNTHHQRGYPQTLVKQMFFLKTQTCEALQIIPVMFIIENEYHECQKQVYTVRTRKRLCIINVLLMCNGQGQKSQDKCWNMDVTLKEPTNVAASGPSGHTASQNIYVHGWKTT